MLGTDCWTYHKLHGCYNDNRVQFSTPSPMATQYKMRRTAALGSARLCRTLAGTTPASTAFDELSHGVVCVTFCCKKEFVIGAHGSSCVHKRNDKQCCAQDRRSGRAGLGLHGDPTFIPSQQRCLKAEVSPTSTQPFDPSPISPTPILRAHCDIHRSPTVHLLKTYRRPTVDLRSQNRRPKTTNHKPSSINT